jgi:hypothetical protein
MIPRPVVIAAALALAAVPPLVAQAPLMSPDMIVPPGFGSLRQDDIQLTFRTSTLEIRFLPLDPRTGNLLANDAYQSFKQLLLNNRARIDSVARLRGISQPGIAYVSFFGLAPGAFYDAESLALTVRSRLFRPMGVVPYTPGFLEQRLDPREVKSAFYLFEEAIPVLEPFEVQYQNQFTGQWQDKLSKINGERQRVALRATKAGAMDSAVKPAGAR